MDDTTETHKPPCMPEVACVSCNPTASVDAPEAQSNPVARAIDRDRRQREDAERVQRWHATFNAYLPIAHELAKLTEDKVPRLMSRTHEYALLFANRIHGTLDLEDVP